MAGCLDLFPPLWSPPCFGSIRGNSDAAVSGTFVVAAAVLSDSSGEITSAGTVKLHSSDVLLGEANAHFLNESWKILLIVWSHAQLW
jgi:hypothetical protein